MRGKLLLTREGGGAKTEIRPNLRGEGWTVIDFEYTEDGRRAETGKTAATDEDVVKLLRQDEGFFSRFSQLCQHPELQA